MKTNAPKKIFLERVLCSNEVYDNWKSQKTISDDIEYIRTDAFIERACEWISNNCYIPHSTLENFKKYMKGE